MKKSYVKEGAKVRIKLPEEGIKRAYVGVHIRNVPPTKYNGHKGGRVFSVSYMNGKTSEINERWMRRGW